VIYACSSPSRCCGMDVLSPCAMQCSTQIHFLYSAHVVDMINKEVDARMRKKEVTCNIGTTIK